MKIRTTKSTWTKFWRSIGVDLGHEERWSPGDIYTKGGRRLRKLGVEPADFNKVKKELDRYAAGHIQFHRLTYLFARDPETVRKWTNARTVSKAFLRLCYKLTKNDRDKARKNLSELTLLMELFRKREIIQYDAKDASGTNISIILARGLQATLKVGEKNARLKFKGQFKFDGFQVYSFAKKSGSGPEVYKFVLLKKVRRKIFINLALDTTDERQKVLGHVSKKLTIPIERLRENPNMRKFINFLKDGNSTSFSLLSADILNEGLRISIYPQYGRPENIAESNLYKSILPTADIDVLESTAKIKVLTTALVSPTTVNIGFVNYKNEDIIGGMRLSLNAKGLNLSKRELLREKFKEDFDFQLDVPLVIQVDEREIYKKFLYNPPKKKKRIQIVSDKTIEISHKLLTHGLLPKQKPTEETAKICTYHGCPLKFQQRWNITGNTCACGNSLWENGTTILTQIIDENRVRDFFERIAKENGYEAESSSKNLITRNIFPLQIRKDGRTLCLIPITVPLKDQQLEALKYRYPDLVFVTSRDDKHTLEAKGFAVEELYSLVFDLLNDPEAKINSMLDYVAANRSVKIRELSDASSARLLNEAWYISQARMGPEFFEADTSTILSYIFRNSIWLGAKRRGEPVPDSLSAFPVDDANRGCFATDAKFSLASTPNIGSVDKNKKYVDDGRKNTSVRSSGGLRGFIFVSNKQAPTNFFQKMKKVLGRKHVKAGYLTNTQVKMIFDHLRRWENDMEMDRRKRDIFLESMEQIFLKPNTMRAQDKIIEWSDASVSTILNENVTKYSSLTNPELVVEEQR